VDVTEEIRLSEVIGALSYALDITEGQPMGHSVRSCLIGMRIAEAISLPVDDRAALFYGLLMKDAGCSSSAAKVSALFGSDDRAFKYERALVDVRKPFAVLPHLWRHSAPGGTVRERAGRFATVLRASGDGARQLMEVRCERGADIARMVGLPEDTAAAIRALDEHWDGGGHPYGLAGEAIPLLGRILCLSQTVEVFLTAHGREAAMDVARARSGTWFDPALVAVLERLRDDARFWSALAAADDPAVLLEGVEPADTALLADDDRLDRVALAFAKVIDAKSPYTFHHSEGVAQFAAAIARRLGLGVGDVRRLRRAALLHDIGKLGVSNTILDKPGKLDADEWDQVRRHPELSLKILRRVGSFRDLAEVAAAHHERLDGTGYFRGVTGDELDLPSRILAVADVAEALSADRPYRAGLQPEQVVEILRRDAGTGLDADAVEAIEAEIAASPAPSSASA
jgi:putative nucleotidyltransferase with HDIG domain